MADPLRTITATRELPPALASHLVQAPLALHSRALATLIGATTHAGPFGEAPDRSAFGYAIVEGVAVVPLMGILLKRGTGDEWIDRYCGIASGETFQRSLATAVADPEARAILLQVDSPGGEVHGMFEAAAAVRAARDSGKPVWAVADEWATSAAYLIASAAERLVAPRTAVLGSIGVMAVRLDATAYDEKLGLKYHVITVGDRKADRNPHCEATDEELTRLSAELERTAGMLFEAVGANRGLSVDAIRGFQAATFNGDDAARVGLTDGVATFGDTIMELATAPRPAATSQGRRRSMSTTAQGAQGGAQVIDIEEARRQKDAAAAEGREAGRAEATAEVKQLATTLRDMCAAAGKPELAADFLADGLTVAQAAAKLAEMRVQADAPNTDATTRPGAQAAPQINVAAIHDKWRAQMRKPAPQAAAQH